MVEFETLVIFIPIALALNITPGADILFCLGQGAKSGSRAGLAAAIGIGTGSFLHAAAAGLGIAAFLAAFPMMFEIFRWSGVAYLLFLAIQTLRTPSDFSTDEAARSASLVKVWRDGAFVCLLNPKVAIFMLALVPQFVEPGQGSIFLQFLVFGSVMSIGGTLLCAAVGMSSGWIGQWLTQHRMAESALQYLSSLIFVGLALKLATDRR